MTSLRLLRPIINIINSRSICLSSQSYGKDSREKRLGHIPKKDDVEGEKFVRQTLDTSSFELVDDRLMDKVIDGIKFKDIPVLWIWSSRNNTFVSLTRGNGDTMVFKSAGTEGYKNCRKGTTVAAQAVANRVLSYIKDHEIECARLVFEGLGPGRGAAYKVFELSKFKIVSLSDRTNAVEPWSLRPRKAKRI